MKLPQLENFDFKEKKVLVRCDLDVPIENRQVTDETRLKECLPTINYLLERGAKVILMGHLGRPGGKVVEELRLAPVAQKFTDLLNAKLKAQSRVQREQNSKLSPPRRDPAVAGQLKIENFRKNFSAYQINENIVLLENLRFDPREEGNDLGFAKELASLGDFYVNEAFAASHREHSSIVGVPKFLPHSVGLHFASEVENLSKVIENPKRPVVVVIGGAKPETKVKYVENFAKIADSVLVGGLLAKSEELKAKNQKAFSEEFLRNIKLKTIITADLLENGLDINNESIKKFVDIIRSAGTVVWNGPMGKYENDPPGGEAGKWEKGTREIAKAVAECRGYKVVGGGDTIAALKKFRLLDKIDYVSTGGGAMLEFLAKGTLPGIKALL